MFPTSWKNFILIPEVLKERYTRTSGGRMTSGTEWILFYNIDYTPSIDVQNKQKMKVVKINIMKNKIK